MMGFYHADMHDTAPSPPPPAERVHPPCFPASLKEVNMTASTPASNTPTSNNPDALAALIDNTPALDLSDTYQKLPPETRRALVPLALYGFTPKHELLRALLGTDPETIGTLHQTQDEIDAMIELPATGADPDALAPPIAAPVPYPVAALGDFGQAVLALHEYIQADFAICAASVLASLSACAQTAFDVALHGRVQPLGLYLLTVAPSGARKSAVDSAVFHAIRMREKTDARQHRADLEQWEADAHGAKKRGEPAPPPAPMRPRIESSDATVEGLQKVLRRGKYGAAALVSDEAGAILGGYSLRGDNLPRGLAVLSGMYDAGTLTNDRADDERSYTLYERRLAIHIQGQGVIVGPFLTHPVVSRQGLLARFLVAQVAAPPAREYRRGNVHTTPGLQRLYETQARLLDAAVTADLLDDGMVRPTMALEADAIDAWERAHNALELRRAAEDESDAGGLVAFLSKAPSHVLRLAGVLAAAHGEATISAARIEAGLALVNWYAADLGRALDTAAASEFDGKADALASWLAQRAGDFLACRDIQRSAPRPVKRMGATGIRALMGRLIEAGYDLTREGRGWRIGELKVGDMGDTGDKPATAPFLVGDTLGDNRATKPATPATPESVAHLSPTCRPPETRVDTELSPVSPTLPDENMPEAPPACAVCGAVGEPLSAPMLTAKGPMQSTCRDRQG